MGAFYLHIPFCRAKCLYCDFFSVIGNDQQIEEYVGLLVKHIGLLKSRYPDSLPCETVFFGGGTPSLLSVNQFERVLCHLDETFGIAQGAEVTIEANPGTLDMNKLEGYRNIGINRLSIGVQSLDDCRLKQLGRIHSAPQARDAVFTARQAGFDNISLDLIFALPGQSLEDLGKETGELLSLQPEHISLYGLSIEEGTVFAAMTQQGHLTPCNENLYADQYRLIHDQLTQAGYEHYEISNFARPGFRCHHNQVYWNRRNCHAVGCGAHSFIDKGWGERWHVPADLGQFHKDIEAGTNPSRLLETFSHREAMKETAYLSLRTSDGIVLSDFQARYRHDPEQIFATAIERCRPYLHKSAERLSFNLDGWLIFDHLISHFL